MSNFNISTRYAKALMEFAEGKESVERVSVDMVLLENASSRYLWRKSKQSINGFCFLC